MDFKQKIQEKFVTAMKNRDEVAKSALSSLKAQILLSEKSLGSKPMDENTFWVVVSKMISQRNESAKIFKDAGREELFQNELSQAEVLSQFLPPQMTDDEIENELSIILESFVNSNLPKAAIKGKTLGLFNQKFKGRCNLENVSNILGKLAD